MRLFGLALGAVIVTAGAMLIAPGDANAKGGPCTYTDSDLVTVSDGDCYYTDAHIRIDNVNGGKVSVVGGGRVTVGYQFGGTVNGGDDADAVYYIYGGTFNGGDGVDFVESLNNDGTFNGGDGADVVTWEEGGTFNGGAGDDSVMALYDGTFNGGAGDDEASSVWGTFNGGPGDDTVGTLQANGTFSGGSGDDSVTINKGGTVWSADTP